MSMQALKESGCAVLFTRNRLAQIRSGLRTRISRSSRSKYRNFALTETELVRAGVSPHAPYTVCGPQLEMIANFARTENLPLMMHAAESEAEESFCVKAVACLRKV